MRCLFFSSQIVAFRTLSYPPTLSTQKLFSPIPICKAAHIWSHHCNLSQILPTLFLLFQRREKKSHVARKISFYWKMFWLYIYNDMLHKMHYGRVDRGLRFFPVGLYNYVMLLWGYTNYSHIKKKLKKWHIEASVCRKISSQLGLCVYLPKIAFALLPTITTLFFTTNNKASNII